MNHWLSIRIRPAWQDIAENVRPIGAEGSGKWITAIHAYRSDGVCFAVWLPSPCDGSGVDREQLLEGMALVEEYRLCACVEGKPCWQHQG
jgi:hypothetical protein